MFYSIEGVSVRGSPSNGWNCNLPWQLCKETGKYFMRLWDLTAWVENENTLIRLSIGTPKIISFPYVYLQVHHWDYIAWFENENI